MSAWDTQQSQLTQIKCQVQASVTTIFGRGTREWDEWFTAWKAMLQGLGQGKSEQSWGKMGVEWWW